MVGLEGVELGARQFFEDHNISFSCTTVKNVENCKLYQVNYKNYTIFNFLLYEYEYVYMFVLNIVKGCWLTFLYSMIFRAGMKS